MKPWHFLAMPSHDSLSHTQYWYCLSNVFSVQLQVPVVYYHYYYSITYYCAELKQISATAQLIVQRMIQEIHKTSPQ